MPNVQWGPPTDRAWQFVLLHPTFDCAQATVFRYYDKPDVLGRGIRWHGRERQVLFLQHADQRQRAIAGYGWVDITDEYKVRGEDPDAELAEAAAPEPEIDPKAIEQGEDAELAAKGLVALDDVEQSVVVLLQREGPLTPAKVREALSLTDDGYREVARSLVAKNIVRRVGAAQNTVLGLVMPEERAAG